MSTPSSFRPDGDPQEVPAAPYPPFLTTLDSNQQARQTAAAAAQLRSSLSSSPHYSNPKHHHHHATTSNTSMTADTTSTTATSNRRGRSHSLGEQNDATAATASHNKSTRTASAATTTPTATAGRLVAPLRVQYSPMHSNLYACINSNTSFQFQPQQQQSQHEKQRKNGPVLLELRKLNLSHHKSHHQSLFQSSTVATSRGNPQLGPSVASTCLSMKQHNNHQSSLTCATGLTTGALCVHSFQQQQQQQVLQENDEHTWVATPNYYTPRHQRLASSVAWKPSSSMVAIGHVGGPGLGMRRGVVGSRAGGGDRDFCCLLWDVEAQGRSSVKATGQSPVVKLSHGAGVASLAWLQDGHTTLAVGSQMRTVQLYDLRVSATNSPPISTRAHTQGVNGIHVDPHRPNVFATFSRSVGEPVKLWDARRMDSCLGEIKTSGLGLPTTNTTTEAESNVIAETEPFTSSSSLNTNTAVGAMSLFGTGLEGPVVSTLKWSFLTPGTLCVAIGDTIRHYETTSSGSRPVLSHVNHADGPIVDFATHQPSSKTRTSSRSSALIEPTPSFESTTNSSQIKNEQPQQQQQQEEPQDVIVRDLQSHRMLVALSDGTVHDMPILTIAPLAISRRDGRIVHALGKTVWVGPTHVGPSAMENLNFRHDEDVSATMMRRARCLHAARYSMDAAANMQMLSEEKPRGGGTDDSTSLQLRNQELLRLWSWIERVESLCSHEALTLIDEDNPWSAKGLMDCGVWKLLGMDSINPSDGMAGNVDEPTYSNTLFCTTYDSAPRRAAWTACGWAGKFPLVDVLADCEALGEFERSAALAVWHGDIGAAVEALQRGSDAIRSQIAEEAGELQDQTSASPRYAETLQLVSMCIAGFSSMDPASTSSSVWRRACTSLLAREELNGDRMKLSGVAYLRGLCTFLINIGVDEGLDKVLHDDSLSLCDRVAFACRFLERRDLESYLVKVIDTCLQTGNLEGCAVTGLERKGIAIIQSYVDRSADVQTAALVCSRVVLPTDWVSERSTCSEFVDSYRDLLNTWQMWQSRAMFDVDRADLLRRIRERQADDLQAAALRGSFYQSRGRGAHGAKKLAHPSPTPKQAASGISLPSVPAQLEARCTYCSMSLSGLRREAGISNQWLNKLKPVLQCCPRCRKPLPRCSICLLSLGCLNPYTELKRAGSRQVRPVVGLQGSDDMTRLANLPFAEWFTWCMRCKHGGHAHHLVGWFANHNVCPVSGCNCQCQFDGIQKLNRPALTKPAEQKS